jgi:predicted glycogen debranching enzyme
MTDIPLPIRSLKVRDFATLIDREWLVTNGLGGYASGTLAGVNTRRYHGILIAAHKAPLGRVMALNHLRYHFRFPDWTHVAVGGNEKATRASPDAFGTHILEEFRLDAGLPVWRYASNGHMIEKRLFMPYRQNTTHVLFTLSSGPGPVRLKLQPVLHFRGYDDPVSELPKTPYVFTAVEHRFELSDGVGTYPILRMKIDGESAAFTVAGEQEADVYYRVEEDRGYERFGGVWRPGTIRVTLRPDRPVVVTASTEPWEVVTALKADAAYQAERDRRGRLLTAAVPAARTGFAADLVLAADQFVITPAARVEDAARAHAGGEEARTVIAGYHWFTDWGRDTMISLEGLTLLTGRSVDARYILRTFAGHMRDGLIPNFFPDHGNEGLYHTADATLWFFHALHRYVAASGDRETLADLLPVLKVIVAHHVAGTRFGIGVDPADGLLRQGAEGYQLTWMDAKVGDWVVTPRRGKAVEINALWYNALRLLETWLRDADDPAADDLRTAADQTYRSFNSRFWNPETNGLFDVIDGEAGDDDAVRPNQVFAVSLGHPVLDPSRWKAVVTQVHDRLLTPVGLRSLAPGHPDYKAKYYGDLRARDAAYHQGTVWAWLIGPFIDAWLRTYPGDTETARSFLTGFENHVSEACIGSVSEIFDAESPFTPRACIAQAWSVAEVLRAGIKTHH